MKTELMSTSGSFIVKNPGCKKCHGRGFTDWLDERNLKLLERKVNKLKELGKIPSDFMVGPYLQCHKCFSWYRENELTLKLKEIKDIKVEEPHEDTAHADVS